MLKVIVIDDEQWSLNYMQSIVDWEENGAEIVAVFNNAADALEFLSQNQDIDLVFVDIEMPEMTGIDFLKQAGEVCRSAELIIISSYDTFEYAQESIRNGAKDYLLKPIEQKDIIRILAATVKLKEQISKETIVKSNINAFLSLDVYKRINEVWSISDSEKLVCCVTDAPDSEINEVLSLGIENELEISCYHSIWHHAFFIKVQGNALNTLIASNKSKKNYKFGFYIAQQADECINDMLIRAKGTFEGKFFSPNSNVFVYDNDYEKWSANYIFTAKKRIDERQVSMVQSCIDDFYAELETKCVQVEAGILFYNKLIDFLMGNRKIPDESGDYFIIDIQHARKKFGNRDELVLFLHCLSDEWGMEFAGELQMSKAKDFIPRIQKYINENCQAELSLSLLSKEFMISGKYLSSIFKKTTGMNLKRYINMVRVKKAAIMLEQTEISIQDVSYLCGYNDCSYFTKIFKQLLGITPSEYRTTKQRIE